jgi:hypothetical protein
MADVIGLNGDFDGGDVGYVTAGAETFTNVGDEPSSTGAADGAAIVPEETGSGGTGAVETAVLVGTADGIAAPAYAGDITPITSARDTVAATKRLRRILNVTPTNKRSEFAETEPLRNGVTES